MAFDDSALDPMRGAADLRFLDGGGAVAHALRDLDWSAHPLGPLRG